MGLLIALVFAFGLALHRSENTSDQDFLKTQFNEITEKLKYRDSLNVQVSEVDVAWHLDHLLKVINKIYDQLASSAPEEYQRNINFTRMAVYISGSMPRGVAKAPDSVKPPEIVETSDIFEQLNEAKLKLSKIDSLDEHANFAHPVFGMLNRQQSKRFIEIHTNHHLAIIRDIIKK